MRRTRPNVKFLVKKYSVEIAAWREPSLRQASWESISRELAGREGLTQEERPTAEGIRVAWIRLQPLATLPTNTLARAVVEPLHKSLADLPTLPTNRPTGAAVAGISQISVPTADGDIFSSDHKRQMQAALERGNLDDL